MSVSTEECKQKIRVLSSGCHQSLFVVTEKAETNMLGSKCAERSVLVLCTPKSLFIKPEQKQHKAVLFRLMSDSGKTMREREKREAYLEIINFSGGNWRAIC